MDMTESRTLFGLQGQHARHVFIHIFGAHRAPEGHDQLIRRRKAQLGPRLLPVGKDDLAAHGRAGQDDFIAAAHERARLLEADEHFVRLLGKHLGRDARIGVDLEQDSRDAQLLRGRDNRERGIAAAANDHVGLCAAQQFFCRADRSRRLAQGVEVVPDGRRAECPAQAGDLDGVKRIALARDQA